MKKSTILILAVVFAVSVFVVGIFGLKNVPYNQRVYVEQIVIDSVTLSNGETAKLQKYDDGTYYIRIAYEQNMLIIVNYSVYPSNATERSLKPTLENLNENSDGALQPNGAILLRDKGTVRVTFRATDQPGAPSVILTIYTK